MSREVRPQYATRRRPERPTLGTECRETAQALGIDLLPWQQDWLDLAGELVPDPDGRDMLVPAYRQASLAVPRRAGKTLAVMVLMLTKMRMIQRCRAFWTAQDQASAVMALTHEMVPLLEDSSIPFHWQKSNGREQITLENKSNLKMFSAKRDALHGQSADFVFIDEGFKFDRERGNDLEIAIFPLLATRPHGQFVTASAAGDADGTYWLDQLEKGRVLAELDRGEGTCHYEFTMEGTDLDPENREHWKLVHPGNVNMSFMESEYERNPVQFRRTFLNIPDRETGVRACISLPDWDRCALLGNPPARDQAMSLGLDCEPDSRSASIVACMGQADHIELIDHRPGVDWVPDRLVELVERWGVQSVAFDNRSPAGVLEARLAAAGLPLRIVGLGESANAAQGFADLVHSQRIRHERHPDLDLAVEGAARRLLGDGGWSFSRKDSQHPVSPLVAASLAWYCHEFAHGPQSIAIY